LDPYSAVTGDHLIPDLGQRKNGPRIYGMGLSLGEGHFSVCIYLSCE